MAYIEFRKIEKCFGEQKVLKNLSLSVEKGELVTLLGSSGCGKSTLLRLLAGLENVTSGNLYIDGEDVTFKSPRQRNVGMIFQQYSLFPTMNVLQNISFGLRMKHMDKDQVSSAVSEAVRMVNLEGSEKKYPSQLSGGEQQRVALARCIVTKPKVLLLDEPFSAIDAKLRKSLQSRIKEIHQELGMTSLFVTHDQDEAMTMSDRICLMNEGVIEQTADPIELYSRPKTLFAASFMGNYNVLSGKEASLVLGTAMNSDRYVIRPELISISHTEFNTLGNGICLRGRIVDRIPQGNIIRYRVFANDTYFNVDRLFTENSIFNISEDVYLDIPRSSVIRYLEKQDDGS